MTESSILILEAEAGAGAAIAAVIVRLGYAAETIADIDAAAATAATARLLVIDNVGGGDGAGADACRRLRGDPALARLPIMCIAQSGDVEERISLLEAGADDVVARPFEERELEARLEALLVRHNRSTALVGGGHDKAITDRAVQLVAVFSPKGGVGTTTVAVNLALAFAQNPATRVGLIDLDLPFGQVATHLNLIPSLTIADLVRDEFALTDAEGIVGYSSQVEGGISVVAAPTSAEEARLVDRQLVETILETARRAWDIVIVDLGTRLDEWALAALDRADRIVVPVSPEFPALKAVHGLLDYLNDTGEFAARAIFVVNEIFDREILRPRDIEEALGTKIAMTLPHDALLYLKAVNEGVPIMTSAPGSKPAEAFARLAAIVAGTPTLAAPAAAERKTGRLGGILGRR